MHPLISYVFSRLFFLSPFPFLFFSFDSMAYPIEKCKNGKGMKEPEKMGLGIMKRRKKERRRERGYPGFFLFLFPLPPFLSYAPLFGTRKKKMNWEKEWREREERRKIKQRRKKGPGSMSLPGKVPEKGRKKRMNERSTQFIQEFFVCVDTEHIQKGRKRGF